LLPSVIEFVPNILPELDTNAPSPPPPPPPPPPVYEAWTEATGVGGRTLGAERLSPSSAGQFSVHACSRAAAREPKHVHLVLSPRLSTRPLSNTGSDWLCTAAKPSEGETKRAAARGEPMHTGRQGRVIAELSEEEPKRRRMVLRGLLTRPSRAAPLASSEPHPFRLVQFLINILLPQASPPHASVHIRPEWREITREADEAAHSDEARLELEARIQRAQEARERQLQARHTVLTSALQLQAHRSSRERFAWDE
jgi:hypothetical protein